MAKSPFSGPSRPIVNESETPDKKSMPAGLVMRRIFKYMRPHFWLLILSVLLTGAQIVATLQVHRFIGEAVDRFAKAGGPDLAGAGLILGMLAGLVCAVFFCQWLSGILTNRVSFSAIRDVRTDAFEKLNRVPLKYIDGHWHGDLMSRIANDADSVSDGMINGFTQIFSGVITAIGALVSMLLLDVKIALVVIFITPLSLLVTWFLAKKTAVLHKKRSEKNGELSGLCEELLGNQKIVKAFNYESRGEEKFDKTNGEIKVYGTKAMFLSSLTNPVTRLLNAMVYAVVAMLGAVAVIEYNTGAAGAVVFTVGSLYAMLAYATQYAKPFNEITGIVTELQTSFAAARRVFAILDEPEETSDKSLSKLSDVQGGLTAESVAFSYEPEKPLIKNFNISVRPGSRIAIVGPTGCGKTTLINLLMRFYDVDSGKICVDGSDINSVTRQSLRQNYGMVLQDSWLFEGTVHDNIAYGKQDATREEVIAAAKQAKCNCFIKRLENGYDTVVTGGGAAFSQGQKQLLCIARIMLTRPPMLILDEATSSIDTRTEARVQTAFARIMEGRTSFIIAHRLGTVVDADNILVMNNGDIIESGTHTELLARNGFYTNLYQSQFAEY